MSNNTKTEAKPFNAINWFEIPTRDMDRAVAFYERTLGLELKREVFGGMPHAVFPAQCPEGGQAVAGAIVASAPHLTPGPAGALIYLGCKDGVAATLARATAAGATVAVPHMAIGEFGFIAVVADPDGNRVGLHAMTA